jgi:hypothetical protein
MIEWVVERLTALLGPIATMAREKRGLKDEALSAVSIALRETKLYYRDMANGAHRSLPREAELVKAWSEAAIPLRHIDEQLAMACEDKAAYWLNPDEWTPEQLKALGIRLQDVSVAYRRMLSPSIR